MQKIFFGIGFLLMMFGIFGMSYTWNHDHRQTKTLEEYATLDFQASRDEQGNLEGAVLSLWDYRYDKAQLLKRAILFTDGAPWEMPAATKQTRAQWMNENKLFVSLPKMALRDLILAKEVRFKFFLRQRTVDRFAARSKRNGRLAKKIALVIFLLFHNKSKFFGEFFLSLNI